MASKTRKKFSCDFETTTNPDDCRVWAYGWMEIGNIENYKIGNNIEDFMAFCEAVKGDLYFHNLKFDGNFIVNWLLKQGWEFDKDGKGGTFNAIISDANQWYMIDICYGYNGKEKLHTVIYDSMKKLPFSVKDIAKGFKLPVAKGDIDYHKERPIGYEPDEDEKYYIKMDIEIVARALEVQMNQGLKNMTIGSDAYNGYKSVLERKKFQKLFPVISMKMYEDIKPAYKGGFTYLMDEYKETEVDEGLIFDVNSLYPAMMYDKLLPYGMPMYFEGEYEDDEMYPLWVAHVSCEFEIKDEHIPTIQLKKHMYYKGNEYLKSSQGHIEDMYVTSVDWELIKDHYHVYDVEFHGGWKFKARKGLFKDYIDRWMMVKSTNKGAKRLLAKLMLNSLYGKFGSNPDVTGKVPYLNDDGSNAFRVGDEELKDPEYIPMSAYITAYAREMSIRTAQKCYDRFIYCDTDSIHLRGIETPEAIEDIIDDNKLGYWAHETTYKRGKYIRQKTYLYEAYAKEIEDDGETKVVECGKDEATTLKLVVKCAGMSEKVKENVTFENFKVGFTSDGKLMPKQVDGGVVLEDTQYTLK